VVYQPFHIVGLYSVIPAEVLNEATVYAGGFPARYGARLASVIDVTLRHGSKKRYGGSLTLSPMLNALSVEGPVLRGTSSFLFSFRHSLLKESAPWLTGEALPYRFGDALFQFHSYLNTTSSFLATGLYSYDEGTFSGTEDRADRIAWNNLAVGLTYWYLPDKLPAFFSARVSLSMFANQLGMAPFPWRRSRVTEFGGEMTYGYLLGDWKVQFALFATDRSFSAASSEARFPTQEFLNEGGMYVEARLPLLPRKLTLEPGVRVHGFPSRGMLTVAPRLRLNGRPGRRHHVMAAYGVYYQPLVAAYDDRDVTQTFVAWIPSPEYAPVPQADHYLAGWRVRLGKGYHVRLEAYHKTLRHMALVAGNVAVKAPRGRSSGMDLTVEYQRKSFSCFLGYSLGVTRYQTAAGWFAPPHDRRHQVHVLLQQAWKSFVFRAHWQIGSGLPYTPLKGFYHTISFRELDEKALLQDPVVHILYGALYSRRLPPYHRLDISLTYTARWQGVDVRLALGMLNVYRQKNLFYYNAWENQRVYQFPGLPSASMQLRF